MWNPFRALRRENPETAETPARTEATDRGAERSGIADPASGTTARDASTSAPAPGPEQASGAAAPAMIEFAVSTSGSVRADAVPAAGEDALPTATAQAPLTRADRVEDMLDARISEIAPAASTASFLTQLRAGDHVLDLTHSHPSGLAQLLAGRGPTRLSSLVREVGALADARSHARALRETAERQAEEIGLITCHLGIGEATWTPIDGSEPLHAPVLVRPLTMRLRGSAREDIELEIDATVDLNPVLLRSLREAGVAMDARALLATTQGPYGFDPNPVLDAFKALGEPLPGFRVTHALVVGNMMDAVGPLADDLRVGRAQWTDDDLVAALADDEEAAAEVAEAARAARDSPRPVDERELVAAVDPDHHAALRSVLSGAHTAMACAPGTDPLDLVVDLTAELVARGRSVLVVSQRRSSLSRIVRSAEDRGLGELLFDLSPDPSLQRNASEALLTSLRRAGSFRAPVPAEEPEELREARTVLAGHVEAMHRTQQPWGVTAHDAISALADLTRRRPAPRTRVRLPGPVAARMIGPDRERFAAQLREAAESGALSTGPEDTAWFGATITTDTQADRALELVGDLREGMLPRLRERAEDLGPRIGLSRVRTLSEMRARLGLLAQVRAVMADYQASVFTAPLADMIAATAEKTWRTERGIEQSWPERRRLRHDATALERPEAEIADPHARLQEVRRVRDAWLAQALPGEQRPRLPEHLDKARTLTDRTQRACDELDVLLAGTPEGAELSETDLEALADRLDALWRDRASLTALPRHTTVLRRLDFDGLGALVADLRDRAVPAAQVADELELAWWGSVLELIAGAEPTISSYDGTSLSRVAETFRRLDAEHLGESGYRVRQAADDVLVSTMKRFPDTSRAAIAELSRSSTTSVRDLAAKYEDIMFRARPAWLASPYLVPQIVPRGRHFDVVIVADGGRLPTWAALPSIIRARQTVVVGDPLEFAGQGEPSLLDDVLGITGTVALHRDPHPATGGLRAFAQRRALDPRIRAVPAPMAAEPDRLVLIDGARGPVSPGTDYVESTEAELRRVTDLVIEHARTRPERSLAVIAFTPTHARAVMDRVMHTVGVIPMLREFFDPEAEEFFTVVPVEQAASITRDDVIVTVGFGRTPHDRLIHHFGPLSGPGGRKAIVTALTRARGRTTVVSALRAEDLDPARLRTVGARDLRDLLSYLYTGEDPALAAEDTALEEDAAAVDAVEGESAPAADPLKADTRAETDPASEPDAGSEIDPESESETTPAAGPDADPQPEPESDPERAPAAESPEVAETPEAAETPEVSAGAADALVADLADRLWRLGLVVDADYGLTEDRIELALGHPDLPGRYLVAVDTDGARYVGTASQRERDRLRAERLEGAGWHTERVWSWALFIDPEGEADRIRRAVERAHREVLEGDPVDRPRGIGASQHRLPRPQIPVGQPLDFYATEDFDAVVEYICSDGRARLEEQLAAEVRAHLGFEQRSVLLDVTIASAIRRYQERL